MVEKEYIRGRILDRKGEVLAWSEEPRGKRFHGSARSCSSLLGYYSILYGTSGLEARYQDVLSHSKSEKGQKRGADLTLTLDKNLQDLAYEQIKDFTGSVVVLDAKSGQILALASSPSYKADSLEENWDKISSKEGLLVSNAYQNPVAPGSVFKLVTSKAILEHHLDKKKVKDKGELVVNGQTIHNYNGTAHGDLTFREGFIKSSNVYFMTMALKMGGQVLTDAARDCLLGTDIELDFTTLHSSWDMEDYEENLVAATAFGQGNTLVTPLHMAMITQSIANDGDLLKPYLVQSVTDARGNRMEEGKKRHLTQTMKAGTARKLREVMTEAGESYGLARVGSNRAAIAAKTGTAQRGDKTNNAWIVSFAPADDPRYVIVVNRLKTKKIGKDLAPILETLYESLL